jgi:hypothetical protein
VGVAGLVASGYEVNVSVIQQAPDNVQKSPTREPTASPTTTVTETATQEPAEAPPEPLFDYLTGLPEGTELNANNVEFRSDAETAQISADDAEPAATFRIQNFGVTPTKAGLQIPVSGLAALHGVARMAFGTDADSALSFALYADIVDSEHRLAGPFQMRGPQQKVDLNLDLTGTSTLRLAWTPAPGERELPNGTDFVLAAEVSR